MFILNYEFVKSFEKKTFTSQITQIELNANKKDSLFWNSYRRIPLTIEEKSDYIRKDSIYKTRNSKKYLDSIDQKENKFKILQFITGYRFKNSSERYVIRYAGLLKSQNFNTVQGYNIETSFKFTDNKQKEKGKFTTIEAKLNYGFSDNRLRFLGDFTHRFDNQNYATLSITGGDYTAQFNNNQPISNLINTFSSLLFKNNYFKLYNLEFAQINYYQDIANGVNLSGKIAYLVRKPFFNSTDFSYFKKADLYSSNNPLNLNDFVSPGFEAHHLMKITLNAKINFGNQYASRPDGKINFSNNKYPTFYFEYEKAFASNEKKYAFDNLNSRMSYELNLSNKGTVAMNLKAGKFFNAKNISFVDYKHFNGNQTHIGQAENYLDVFNLLPYYTNSTNDSYFEAHFEQNDRGFLTNKIPLLNKLKVTMALGFHILATPQTKPYYEYTIGLDNLGFGKIKLFRLDYVRSYQNGVQREGVVFGLKFLEVFK